MKFSKLVAFAVAGCISVAAFAKDKLYVVNTSTKTGSYNAIMLAYSEDLKKYYDVEFLQGNGCVRAMSLLDTVKAPVFFNWRAQDSVDAMVDRASAKCGRTPTLDNFVKSDISYPVWATGKEDVRPENFVDSRPIKVAVNHPSFDIWLEGLAKLHNKKITPVRYKNSNEITLALINKEVDFGLIGAHAYVKQKDKIRGAYTVNPQGELGLPALSSATKFPTEAINFVALYMVENVSADQRAALIAAIQQIHADANSEINKYYSSRRAGYADTSGLTHQQLFAKTQTILDKSADSARSAR